MKYKNYILGVIIGFFVIIIAFYYFLQDKQIDIDPGNSGGVMCTMDAFQCPDGSYVGRQGPNCQFAPCPAQVAPKEEVPSIEPTSEDIVPVGTTVRVNDIDITLNKIVQDSRCPIDVQCIQAGKLEVNVTLKRGTDKITRNMSSDADPISFSGYKVFITDVMPVRLSQSTIKNSDYAVTFWVGRNE